MKRAVEPTLTRDQRVERCLAELPRGYDEVVARARIERSIRSVDHARHVAELSKVDMKELHRDHKLLVKFRYDMAERTRRHGFVPPISMAYLDRCINFNEDWLKYWSKPSPSLPQRDAVWEACKILKEWGIPLTVSRHSKWHKLSTALLGFRNSDIDLTRQMIAHRDQVTRQR